MHLYFLRHGKADWPDWKKPDDERPLTKAGRKEMHLVAAFLASLEVHPDVILTSPLPRAAQTAEITGEHLKVHVHEEPSLKPGFRMENLKRLQETYPKQVLMLVGHEPDFTQVIAGLTGATVKLAKAGVALVDADGMKGRLLWLFPPKVTKSGSK